MIGPPGSGKGTQGRALQKSRLVFHCSCGEVFRSLDEQSDIGKLFHSHAKKGRLVPDEVAVVVWLDHIRRNETEGKFYPNAEYLLLDGIPRNANQATLLSEHVEVIGVLVLDGITNDELTSRLRRRAMQERREDDASDKTIQHRLVGYERETKALLTQYPPDLVCQIYANASPESVFDEITRHIMNKLKSVIALKHNTSLIASD